MTKQSTPELLSLIEETLHDQEGTAWAGALVDKPATPSTTTKKKTAKTVVSKGKSRAA